MVCSYKQSYNVEREASILSTSTFMVLVGAGSGIRTHKPEAADFKSAMFTRFHHTRPVTQKAPIKGL